MRFLFLSSLRVSLLALITASGFLIPCNKVAAQELNARITINHSQIQGTDNAVFDELQQTLTQFVNDRQWTALQFQKNERIPCSFNFTVTNRGEGPARVARVWSTCGCTVSNIGQEQLQPGESTELKVVFTGKAPGPFHKSVFVSWAPPTPSLRIDLTGTVRP